MSVKATRRADGLELLLVGSAASLLEGDELLLDVRVSGVLPVIVRSVAAQVAHPCPAGGSTIQRIRLELVDHARVFWCVEPLIVTAGSRHRNEFLIDADPSSAAVVVDGTLLGRTNEDPASAALRAEVSCRFAGNVLLEDGIDTTLPGCFGPAGLNGRRFVSSAVALGWRPTLAAGDAMALAGEGAVLRRLGVEAASAGAVVADVASTWWSELLARPCPYGTRPIRPDEPLGG